jgi:hypothetical protein
MATFRKTSSRVLVKAVAARRDPVLVAIVALGAFFVISQTIMSLHHLALFLALPG